jgi:lipopolysaccharide transport system ATP-binding protein
MSDIAISVQGLSKRYVIGHQRSTSRDGLRHSVEKIIRNPLAWIKRRRKERRAKIEEFWALRDLSFQIQEGEAIGIIGHNGAGKSTLLKILSRITEPTTGQLRLRGKVASLLEVGTGFHGDLTGRENIFLNGAILGMKKAEIRRKFDEIVAFAENERFLDTPVKRYSSGMSVRLAFAVAAHLEPEILVVDEVLAVGDAAFRKKCLWKMGEAAKGGRTVLFVSHNMEAVRALCKRALLLRDGHIGAIGDTESVIERYLSEAGSAATEKRFSTGLSMGEALTLESFSFSPDPVVSGGALRFRLVFRAAKPVLFRGLVLMIDSIQGARVALLDLTSPEMPVTLTSGQHWNVDGVIRSMSLVEGDYSVGLTVDAGEFFLDYGLEAATENVFGVTAFTVDPRPASNGKIPVPLMYRGAVDRDFDVSYSLNGAQLDTADQRALYRGSAR